MTDKLRSGTESKLIGLSKAYNKSIAEKDAQSLKKLFSSKVVLYGDKLTVRDDIKGLDHVVGYWQGFFDNYEYTRVEHLGAVDEKDRVAFSIVTDKGTKPKKGNRDHPSNVISLTLLEFDSSDLISGIHIARQLPYDEAERKLKKIPDYSGSSFNPEDVKNESIEPNAQRAKQQEKYAELWNQMFCDNDVSKAEEICDKDVTIHNLLTSSQSDGLDKWKHGLASIFKDWDCRGNEHYIAVTPGNKAFVYWKTTGVYKGDWSTNWGITFLTFNDDVKISDVASIYQPFPGQWESLVKGY